MTSERERADEALVQLDEHSKQLQVKTSQIHVLTLEAQSLKLELQTCTASAGSAGDRLRDEASVLRRNLADEKEKNENRRIQTLELEPEQVKEELERTQQLAPLNEKLHQQHEVEELRKKLQDQEVMSQQTLDELRSQLEEDAHELRAKVDQQIQASEIQLEELKCKLSEQQETSDKVLDDLRLKFSEQGKTAELLKAQLEEARSKVKGSSCFEEEVKRLNSELQTEVAALREKLSNIEEAKETETTPTEMDKETEERASAELQKKLLEKEVQVTALQKSLQEALERREEEEVQAVQEARRREVERRRELLAVAHEAIAQKDEELEKKGGEINR